jgi:hypothetical protein
MHSLKTISDRPDDAMLLLLKKLEHVARSLGSRVQASYYVDPLGSDDGLVSFDEAVASVLKTAEPIKQHSPLDMPAMVMARVLMRIKMNIRDAHALNIILKGDGCSSTPDRVFKAVRATNSANFNQYTKSLLDIGLHSWRISWRTLIDQALQQPGANKDRDIQSMQETYFQLGARCSRDDIFSALAPGKLQNECHKHTKISATKPDDQSEKQIHVKVPDWSAGFSKQRLSRAFDELGRDIEKSDIDSVGLTSKSDLETEYSQPVQGKEVQQKPSLTPHSGNEYCPIARPTPPIQVRDDQTKLFVRPQVCTMVIVGALFQLVLWLYHYRG